MSKSRTGSWIKILHCTKFWLLVKVNVIKLEFLGQFTCTMLKVDILSFEFYRFFQVFLTFFSLIFFTQIISSSCHIFQVFYMIIYSILIFAELRHLILLFFHLSYNFRTFQLWCNSTLA